MGVSHIWVVWAITVIYDYQVWQVIPESCVRRPYERCDPVPVAPVTSMECRRLPQRRCSPGIKRKRCPRYDNPFSNPHNFGPERTFWTFSVLKMIVLSLAIQWTKKYFDFGLIYVCGSCSNRATIKAFQPILRHLFSNPHNFGLGWTFWTFSVLKMIVLSLAIWWAQKYFDFGLICAWVGCSNRVPIKADFAIFWGGGYFS